MSTQDKQITCAPEQSKGRHLASKQSELTPVLKVARILPQRQQRMIGPFCFLDHFGPTPTDKTLEFDIPPHPHIGLQTLSWLWSGTILHLDSLGYEQWLRPGEVNLMTSGNGLCHAEVIPAGRQSNESLHGIQLWIALPPDDMDCEPEFVHTEELPSIQFGDFQGTLILGAMGEHLSAVPTRSPAVAFELDGDGTCDLNLNPNFEYLLYVAKGDISIRDEAIKTHEGYVIGPGETAVEFSGAGKVFIIGGKPFPQPVKMFWNFVAMDQDTLKQAAREWNAEDPRFGTVSQYTQYGQGPARLRSPTWD
ncbi:pirin family protein [Aliidiomarina halalkaliphila]|uniref:Pirin family protein n=1 Tax=Aliidiomarina halalkaliphila TaxID=2593535 RepID=A0A552X3J4_9GAMM|nr:pirin family protein [Aliidiomarina halalkaliphila]TRW49536.1 pirin family protein [Aliidiomarina halalkaliphila]